MDIRIDQSGLWFVAVRFWLVSDGDKWPISCIIKTQCFKRLFGTGKIVASYWWSFFHYYIFYFIVCGSCKYQNRNFTFYIENCIKQNYNSSRAPQGHFSPSPPPKKKVSCPQIWLKTMKNRHFFCTKWFKPMTFWGVLLPLKSVIPPFVPPKFWYWCCHSFQWPIISGKRWFKLSSTYDPAQRSTITWSSLPSRIPQAIFNEVHLVLSS